jgi:hypothetical protein
MVAAPRGRVLPEGCYPGRGGDEHGERGGTERAGRSVCGGCHCPVVRPPSLH